MPQTASALKIFIFQSHFLSALTRCRTPAPATFCPRPTSVLSSTLFYPRSLSFLYLFTCFYHAPRQYSSSFGLLVPVPSQPLENRSIGGFPRTQRCRIRLHLAEAFRGRVLRVPRKISHVPVEFVPAKVPEGLSVRARNHPPFWPATHHQPST